MAACRYGISILTCLRIKSKKIPYLRAPMYHPLYFFINSNDFHADINECSSNPCLNGGACVDQVNGYVCNCQPGYIGSRCQTQLSCKSTVRCKPFKTQ